MDGPLKKELYLDNQGLKKQTAKALIVQGRQMLRGDSSCMVAMVDTNCIADISELMTGSHANLVLHHSVVVATMRRPVTKLGKDDKRTKAYFEVWPI
jgi:hypothetical protein